jgi:ATP-dependent exoDNAse (exonuclease V) alpha subunit
MAIYRLSADIVRRSVGRTVTAAAAYRAGELIVDERTGLAFDYRRRRGVLDAAILAPANAPAWILDRARLWNAVERTEKRKDAQLAREIELALPHELTPAARRELVHGFVRAVFVTAGMVADIAIHAPGGAGDARNVHAHILLTMRVIAGDGFGPKVRAWNDPAMFEQWRALWAGHVNRALETAGEPARVDHRSLEAQGIERLAQIHLGPAVIEMQRRGIKTERVELAQEIETVNAALVTPQAAQDFAAASTEAVQAREHTAAPIMPRKAFRASTARENTRAPPIEGQGLSTLFRRLARALTVRIRRLMTAPRTVAQRRITAHFALRPFKRPASCAPS